MMQRDVSDKISEFTQHIYVTESSENFVVDIWNFPQKTVSSKQIWQCRLTDKCTGVHNLPPRKIAHV